MIWAASVAVIVSALCLVYMFLNMRDSGSGSGASSGWTVYGSDKCSWTRKQKSDMDSKGIQYNFVDCDTQNCPGVSGFPTLKHDDGTVKVGYTPM
jgi:hypothetical protein